MTTATNQAFICYMKIAIWRERNDTYDIGRCKFVKGDFSSGEINRFLAPGLEFSPHLQSFALRFRGWEKVEIWGRQQSKIRGGDIFSV